MLSQSEELLKCPCGAGHNNYLGWDTKDLGDTDEPKHLLNFIIGEIFQTEIPRSNETQFFGCRNFPILIYWNFHKIDLLTNYLNIILQSFQFQFFTGLKLNSSDIISSSTVYCTEDASKEQLATTIFSF